MTLYEYKEERLTVMRDGHYVSQDVAMYEREWTQDGWEIVGRVEQPSNDPNAALFVYQFRRPKP